MTATMARAYRRLEDYDGATPDPSVICILCTGPHLPRYCPNLPDDVAAELELELRPSPCHGTMAQAVRERRAGGNAALCPPCRAVWQADQRKHRNARRARAAAGRP